MNTSVPAAAAEADPASSSDLAEGEAGQPRGPVVAPMSRETLASFWRGWEAATIYGMAIVDQNPGASPATLKSKMREGIKQQARNG